MTDYWEMFKKVHTDNPEIYDEFKKASFKLINAGVKRYSADGIMHVVRFLTIQTMKPESKFKINNNIITFYARLFVREYPEHSKFFQNRIMRATLFYPALLDEFIKVKA